MNDHEKLKAREALNIMEAGDIEDSYHQFIHEHKEALVDLSEWLPVTQDYIKPLYPGELVVVVGDTGSGKTCMLQNIAHCMAPLPTLMFHLELPNIKVFERQVALANKMTQAEVRERYINNNPVDLSACSHIYSCDLPGMSVELIEGYIEAATTKAGEPIRIVMIDYIGLMDFGKANNRYTAISRIAQDLKGLAKDTNTVVFVVSQMGRKDRQDVGEIYLHDARDSSSIEQSCQLLLGIWPAQDEMNPKKQVRKIKVVKQTAGDSGKTFTCSFDGPTMVMRG